VGLFNIPLDGGPPIRLVAEQAANPVWSPDGRFLLYSGVEVGTTLLLKAVTADGEPYRIPELILSRGANRFSFLPGGQSPDRAQRRCLVQELLISPPRHWTKRQLTNFSRDSLINDFDVSPDGKEIIFSRQKENANVILIDLPETR
jgi:Tol biopolymer transport system component